MHYCKSDLKIIPGIGEKVEQALARINIFRTYDFLFHFPCQIISRKLYPPLYSLKENDQVILKLKIIDIDQPNNIYQKRSKAFTIYCGNETGRINLCYFNYFPNYLLNWAKKDSDILVIGKIDIFNKLKQISHPEIFNPLLANLKLDKYEVIYSLTYGIVNKQIQKYIKWVLDSLINIEEWIPSELIERYNWPSLVSALKKIHYPSNNAQLSPLSPERQRIAFDEMLATQLTINIMRKLKNTNQGIAITTQGSYFNLFCQGLPFELTKGQKSAIEEIFQDQKSPYKMSRLIQGDVGSGKTMVAFAAILNVAEAKLQSVLMAPTDILANQLFLNFQKFCSHLPINVSLLTGKTKPKDSKNILEGLAEGTIDILIGTHAVFQEKVVFKNLALVVIDEQHRFGVNQRLSLVNKGNNPDTLIMSATPIPRSLSLTLYGDMDISRITEKPKDRIRVKTSVLPESKIDEIIASMDKIINDGGKIFWVCPLIDYKEDQPETDRLKTAAQIRAQELAKRFPGKVGLVHGQLDNNAKQEALDKFLNNEYSILVATTVIEVGVDVPDATVMLIENAESFGLAQLHQLRGRVGRGNKASHCLLLYKAPLSNISWERLKTMRESDDGFFLAERDLQLRGSGDIVGVKQSGLPNFKAVDFIFHHNLIAIANEVAKRIIKEDPFLENHKNKKYYQLLSLFSLDFNFEKNTLNILE